MQTSWTSLLLMGAGQGPEQSCLYWIFPDAGACPTAQASPLPTPPCDRPMASCLIKLNYYLSTWPLGKSHSFQCQNGAQQAIPSLSLLPTSSRSFLPAQTGEGYSSKSTSKTFLAFCPFLQVPPPVFKGALSELPSLSWQWAGVKNENPLSPTLARSGRRPNYPRWLDSLRYTPPHWWPGG